MCVKLCLSLRVLKNRVLRKMAWYNGDRVTGDWRRSHNEKLCDLYCPNIIWVIKSRRMRGIGHVACMGER
jgi:hypothetical protein